MYPTGGMTTEFLLLQLLLGVSMTLSLGFLGYCLQYRDKRGVRALAVMFVGISIWILAEFIQIQLQGEAPGVGMAIRVLGIEITVIGILFLGLEYTGRERLINPVTVGLLTVEPGIVVGLSLSPYREVLFETAPAASAPWGYEIVMTPAFGAHIVYSYLLVFASFAMLTNLMWRANYGYRRQIFAVLVAVLVPTTVNASFHLGVLPFDLTPISFVFTATVLVFATVRLRLLDAIPVARQTVIEEMDEIVLVLDENDEIITTNAAATAAFGLDRPPVGTSVKELLDADGLCELGANDSDEFGVKIDGDDRLLEISSSQISDYRGNMLARVLVCRDVTEKRRREEQLRRREEELELLKDLQSRFLRHNLRNELNVVRVNAELLAADDDPEQQRRYEEILAKTDRILEWGTKARTIERLVETDATVTADVVAELELLLDDLRAEFPDVAFDLDAPERPWIDAVPQVDQALQNVLDNAARHNTADQPRVRVSVEADDDQVRVSVSDNGPGIDAAEIDSLEDEQETQLRHATGLGLWLVYWVVEKSDGEMAFDVEDGTTVTLTFDRAAPPSDDREALERVSAAATAEERDSEAPAGEDTVVETAAAEETASENVD
jgi:PAS domain S-box-containing protein